MDKNPSCIKVSQSINKILKALFDINPVDETGRVDLDKITKIMPVVNLALPKQSRKDDKKTFFGAWENEKVKDLGVVDYKVAKEKVWPKPKIAPALAKISPQKEFEALFSQNLNIKKEIKLAGGKTVAGKGAGKPRIRPIPRRIKERESEKPNTEYVIHDTKYENSDENYEAVLRQINEKMALSVDDIFAGEPRKIDPLEYWNGRSLPASQVGMACDVRHSSEVESWVRYTKKVSGIKCRVSSAVSVFNSKFRLLLKSSLFRRSNFLAVGMIGLAVSALVLLGRYGIGIKNEIVQEGNSAVLNLEEANKNIKAFDFAAASNNFAEAYKEFSRAGESLNFMGASITSLFAESLDKLGTSKLKSAKNLVEAGKLLAEAGNSMSEAVSFLSETAAIFKLSTLPTYDVGHVDNFGSLRRSLISSSKKLSKASELLADVSPDVLPEDKQEKFKDLKSQDLNTFKGLIDNAVGYVDFLEGLVGSATAKKYLILFQNNSELRPTGGFPGTYAVVTFENGRLKEFRVDDVYNLDGQLKENIIPPVPLQHITPTWGMRDANWFIDFSVSAQKVMEFFKKEAGYEVDGVMTMSPQIISDILKSVGPIEMPEYDSVIDSENFISTIQEEIEYGPNRQQPKKIVMDMAPKLLEKINSAEPAQWLEIFNVFMAGLDRQDILMYFRDLNLENFVAEKGFGGMVKNTGNDYLMVTASNVKGSKTDRVTDNSIKLDLQPAIHNLQQAMKHKLTIARRHNGGETEYGFYNRQNPAFVRVLIPEDAELIGISGNSRPDFKPLIDYSGQNFERDPDLSKLESSFKLDGENDVWTYRESGKKGVAFWMIVDPGETKTVELEYAVLFDYSPSTQLGTSQGKPYSIYIQKQPGLKIQNFEFKAGDAYIYNGELERDIEFKI